MNDFNDPYYEDDNYEDEQHYPNSQDNSGSQYKYYFQFDMKSWSNWLFDALNNIDKGLGSVPVNDYFSNTASFKNSLYLGNNHYKEPIFKTKYFIPNKLDCEYRNHLRSHAVHFLQQPNYYEGLFDILN
jgi:hypothetical protein